MQILGHRLLFNQQVSAQVSDVPPSRVVDSRQPRSLDEETFRARTREHFIDDYDYGDEDAAEGGEIVRTGKSFRSRHFTPFLQAREELCFTVNLKKADTLTIHLLVLRGGDGKLWLVVRDQQTKVHIDPKMPAKEQQKVINAPRDGSYDICISNKWSVSHSKVASVDISIAHQKEFYVVEGKDGAKLVEKEKTRPGSTGTEQDDPFLKEDDTKEKARQLEKDFAAIEQIRNVIRKLQMNIGRTKMYIFRLKSLMRTDAFYQRDQHTWISSWSSLVCVSMFIVYFAEVYLIRHWFNNNSSSGRKGVYKQTGMRMGL
ncbi:uncharacterized protein LOC142339135 isoform X2 [Convolutriloba macropyga]|uniref:uncharacterized protein LOC142339135 isoform X2 n=1 Tax=Convolutriloba macropyga TaxID=536237 RepID=UPI003F51FC8E